MKFLGRIIAPLALAMAVLPLSAQDLVSQKERAAAQDLGFAGPTESKGLSELKVVGTIPLVTDFPALAGRQLRARTITLEPGGVIAVHKHEGRPGIAYYLEGEVVEHRSDSPEPIVRRKGDVTLETPGLIHWMENRGDVPARIVAIDIAPE
ncbi:MAG TPA: cupin domain-containing protein [Opitutaceae bacterium]